jgi:hypothetical protein
MATATLLPEAVPQFFDSNGNPLSGGSVYFYTPNTTTPKAVWSDAQETNQIANPVVLDGAGRPQGGLGIYGSGQYQMLARDALGNQQWSGLTQDLYQLISDTVTGSFSGTTVGSDGSRLIGFRPGVGGSVPRTVHDKLSEWVSVLDFGADPTGGVDSSQAIQAACSASQFVYFPPKVDGTPANYLINQTINLQTGQHLKGAGYGIVTVTMTAPNLTMFQYNVGAPAQANLLIEDFGLVSNVANTGGIYVKQGFQVTYRNLYFLGCSAFAIWGDQGYHHLAENCVSDPYADTQKGGPFKFGSSNTGAYMYFAQVINCKCHTLEEIDPSAGMNGACVILQRVVDAQVTNLNAARLDSGGVGLTDGIQLEGDCQGVTITGGFTYGARYGVLIEPGSGSDGDCFWRDDQRDCRFIAPRWKGIGILGVTGNRWQNIVINACQFLNPASASSCIFATFGFRLVVSNCVFNQQGTQGNTGVTVANIQQGSIAGNHFNNLGTGLELRRRATRSSRVHGNTFTNVVNPAIGTIDAGFAIQNNPGFSFGISQPAVPASNAVLVNPTGLDCYVVVAGGTGVNIKVNGLATGQASGLVFLKAGATIALTYSAAPTWTWTPLS